MNEFDFSRVDALKDELHRLETMTHLTKEEKEFLIKEKQDVLFKSVISPTAFHCNDFLLGKFSLSLFSKQ